MEHTNELRRCLTAFDLTLLGIGAIIGAGIFVLTGIAAATQAGPAIIFSYLLAGTACAFTAFAYAELASSFGGCGGAYGYAYKSVGEFFAWMMGWDLLLEYGLDISTVSIGWSGYLQHLLSAIHLTIPRALSTDPFHGGIVNLPAVFIILSLATLMSIGTKQGVRFNNFIVVIKLVVLAIFIAIGFFHFNSANWQPFMPFGFQGIVNGASFIFFAYIGFDALATAGEESVNPKRDLPIGIIASLIICTLIYILVAALLTGIAKYTTLNVTSPVAQALHGIGFQFSSALISVGAVAGLTAAILPMFFGVSRVSLAMARDGLLPQCFVKIDKKSQTPRRLIWSVGAIIAGMAGFCPISDLANLVNIGTLAAFVGVCGIVIALRINQPNLKRSFKTPWGLTIPIIGVLLCFYLMISLPRSTWISFMVWTTFGIFIYLSYSRVKNYMAETVIPSEAG